MQNLSSIKTHQKKANNIAIKATRATNNGKCIGLSRSCRLMRGYLRMIVDSFTTWRTTCKVCPSNRCRILTLRATKIRELNNSTYKVWLRNPPQSPRSRSSLHNARSSTLKERRTFQALRSSKKKRTVRLKSSVASTALQTKIKSMMLKWYLLN